MLIAISVFAKSDTTAHSSAGSVGSRFYFPVSIGVSVPFRNVNTRLTSGLALSTGLEYRLRKTDGFFFRVEYDALNNNYKRYTGALPTNIVQGKLFSGFVLGGAGYRKKLSRWEIFASLQPGLGIRSFERADINAGGVYLNKVTNDSFATKAAIGLEYYIRSNFNLFFEPSYYKYFSSHGFSSYHSRFLSFNIGFSAARF